MPRPRHSSETSSHLLSSFKRYIMPLLGQRSPEPFCWYQNLCNFCEVDHGPQVAHGFFRCSKGAKSCPGTYYVSEKAAWAAHQSATDDFMAKKEKRAQAFAKQVEEEAESWQELERYYDAVMARRKLRREVRRIGIAGRPSTRDGSDSSSRGNAPPCALKGVTSEKPSPDDASMPWVVVVSPAGHCGRKATAEIRKRHDEQYAIETWSPPPRTSTGRASQPTPTPFPIPVAAPALTPSKKLPTAVTSPALSPPIAQPRPRYASSTMNRPFVAATAEQSPPHVRQRSLSRAHLYRQVPATPPPVRALPPKPAL